MTAAAAVVGIGQTVLGRGLAKSSWELALEASRLAAEDAGIDVTDIDGICRFVSPFEQVTAPMMVQALGISDLRFFAEAPLGGEGLGGVFGFAAAAIRSGQASKILIYRALSQSRDGRFGRADGGAALDADVVAPEADNQSFAWPYGLMSPGHQFALQATRYAHDAGISIDQLTEALATIAVTQRQYAHANPRAIMRDRPMTKDDYYASRMITWPLRLYDYCLENDGAVAFIVSAESDAAEHPAVRILATSQSLSPYQEPLGLYQRDIGQAFPAAVADRLFADAGVTPQRIRVAALYDACSLMPVRSLEAYGLAEPGQGWRHVVEQGIGLDSPLPINTHGGHLSEGYVHGMTGVLEAVRQVRGAAATQVADADVALVGAPAGGAVILGRGER